ncbi:MAG: transcription antitermination factor NusB [Holosporaceae bacterium]|jgi:N utilization substance protein B|nr:transcription antitermination factor NusB [Holosporaceae bacterium]
MVGEDNPKCGGLRSMARYHAVQVVYRAEITKSSLEKILGESKNCNEIFITENISTSQMDEAFFRRLIKTMDENLPKIDEIVSNNLSDNWRMDRLDSVIKAILRLGTTELLYFEDIPSNVVFNEYIEISKSFFGKSEAAFVNGLLNSINPR